MAKKNYQWNPEYSEYKNNGPEFTFDSFDSQPEIGQVDAADSSDWSEKFTPAKDTAYATAAGARNGGVSGALTSGGTMSLMSGNPYGGLALAGGLILSQIEESKRQEEQNEIQRIKDEREKLDSLQSMAISNSKKSYMV